MSDMPDSSTIGAASLRTVSCNQCGGAIPLRALGQSVMAACAKCGSQFDVSRPDIRLIQRHEIVRRKFLLPLGRRGVLRNHLLEVVGAMMRREGLYTWEEYLLFNPVLGFRWLIQDQGHWNFGEAVKDVGAIERGRQRIRYAGQTFDLYHRGKLETGDVIGEFPWRVSKGSKASSTEYIAPPMLLATEKLDREISWVLFDYLEPAEVEAAFKITSPMRITVAPNQTNRYYETWRAIKKTMLASAALALAIQVVSVNGRHEQQMVLGSLPIGGPKTVQSKVFGPFELAASHSINELTASASQLSNSWVELGCALVNETSGTSYEFTNAFEYYQGQSYDGPWSEGSHADISTLSAIPAGTYSLVVDAESGRTARALPDGLILNWRHDIAPWRNFWLSLLGILTYPGYLMVRAYRFRRARWADSEFDPFGGER